jgi:hypothetical protein
MAKPDPRAGLVIRYDYLWKPEKLKGRAEGSKHRPCAVVVVIANERALVCGITHTQPDSPEDGVEIPSRERARLGLDQERQWVITSEANIVDWDDPGIVPLPSGDWSYGELTRELAEAVRSSAVRNLDQKRLTMIQRGV